MSHEPKDYCYNDLAGCVTQRKNQVTGTIVGVYNSDQAGLDDDPSCKWTTVCEQHDILVGHRTLKLALSHAADPTEWCHMCRGETD